MFHNIHFLFYFDLKNAALVSIRHFFQKKKKKKKKKKRGENTFSSNSALVYESQY